MAGIDEASVQQPSRVERLRDLLVRELGPGDRLQPAYNVQTKLKREIQELSVREYRELAQMMVEQRADTYALAQSLDRGLEYLRGLVTNPHINK